MASAEPPGPSAAAAHIDRLLQQRAPTLGDAKLVCIDGPAGSGKTTLAEEVRRRLADRGPEPVIVHMDDLYPGWEGLGEVAGQLAGLLRPMAQGRSGRYRRYDWLAARWAEEHQVSPTPVVVVEGVGAASAIIADLITVTVWVVAPHDLRMRRGIERDGESFAAQWTRWADDEDRHFATDRTVDRADLVVHGDSGRVTPGPGVREPSPPG